MTDLWFIVLSLLLAYIYAGYPMLLFLMARLFPQRHRRDDRLEPTVTLIISAHNEEKVIGEKLTNSLRLDYPPDKVSVVVVSDGSTDGTDEIVRSFADRGVRLVRPAQRRGKTAGLNVALAGVTSEITVFSDANAMYDRSAIRRLVRHFADEKVGYAVGYAHYENAAQSDAGKSENTYWNIEVKMKEWESAFSSVVGGDGAMYAIRTALYEPMQETDINDFVNPLQIVAKGYRGIFDPEARCSEHPAAHFGKEFSRKVRIANRSFNGLLRVPQACSPLRVGRFAWLLISHKLLRWFSPFFLCLHFAASLGAGADGPAALPALGCVFMYGAIAYLALLGWWQDKRGASSATFYIPYYFMLMNTAAAIGIIMRLKGKVIVVWETVRADAAGRDLAKILPLVLLGIVFTSVIRISLWFDLEMVVPRAFAQAFFFPLFHSAGAA